MALVIGLDLSEAPGGEPTAYIVENADLLPALLASLQGVPDVTFFAPDSVAAFETKEGEVADIARLRRRAEREAVRRRGRTQFKVRGAGGHPNHDLAVEEG